MAEVLLIIIDKLVHLVSRLNNILFQYHMQHCFGKIGQVVIPINYVDVAFKFYFLLIRQLINNRVYLIINVFPVLFYKELILPVRIIILFVDVLQHR